MNGEKLVLRTLSIIMALGAVAWGFNVWRQVQNMEGDGPPIGAICVALPGFGLLIGAGRLDDLSR